ncbi:MAG: hypothetical protein ACR2HP_04095 [Ilumatobacteraceae bacterium]
MLRAALPVDLARLRGRCGDGPQAATDAASARAALAQLDVVLSAKDDALTARLTGAGPVASAVLARRSGC